MDIQINQNGLVIQSGGFIVGPSNRQELEILIKEEAGNIRSNPKLGVGINNYLNGANLYLLQSVVFNQASQSNNQINGVYFDASKQEINIDCNDI